MDNKHAIQSIRKSAATSTRDAVETAIDLAKEGLYDTWAGRIKKSLAKIPHWTQLPPAPKKPRQK